MEKKLEIKTRDGFSISGIYYNKEKNQKNLVIFLHGLTGLIDSYLIKRSVDFFYHKNFDVFVYNKYSDEEIDGVKKRALYEGLTMSRQSQDLQDVFYYFKEKYDSIYLVGHSNGGLAIVVANILCSGQALWDPTFNQNVLEEQEFVIRKKDLPIVNWDGQYYLINDELLKNSKIYTKDKVSELCSKIEVPTKIIVASKSTKWNDCYEGKIKNSDFEILEDANHNFTKLGQVDDVCQKTYEFFMNKCK
ncbi:MAG: hypothetical protein N4A44_00385 [Alphaproteobacteria bacterium]|jgi:predicted alpha/beta-fold hydrolase|nr:hypothetical protein [Alphaproteobacteria bacterium]